ncbi:class I SAM-dependent methyltransferase [Caproiciproducens sp. NJN-50]|uniref:class I SAM-dependent methyltransferase n=1 Tax=Acutalibacteraceae TaxID=3082771 RepID=UPI000FFE1965|nr:MULTISPECIES: class I SAM-dependent methyltransferase [Acutalibacteraceae]QAT50880.1 class I SAM-dependent methyltransferase [Caproiciproducens sp. NJN-50]
MNPQERNADRFTGFAGLYDGARPHCPPQAIEEIKRYLGRSPETVVDLGCGTGLSTLAWTGHAGRVVGIEPNADMLAAARGKAEGIAGIEFHSAFANDTGLPDACADAVTCSQSFHWMEPAATLPEIARILRPGGVFAAYDYDWPPVCGARAELEFQRLDEYAWGLEEELCPGSAATRWDKSRHLRNIRESGYFSYARELLFSNSETCTAERLTAMLASRSGFQKSKGFMPERMGSALMEFSRRMWEIFGDAEFSIEFCYRMRLGMKA